MFPVKQSTALDAVFFAFDSNGDGVTGKGDGDWTKRISKNAGAFAAMTVTVSERENGFYVLTLSSSHTDTLGVLTVSLSATGVKRVNLQWRVHARVPDDLAYPTTSGRSMDVDAAGGVEVGSFQAGALTSGAFAADAIDASALAASAVTEIQAGLATGAALATVQADTDDLQARLPAALVGGRMDASVGAMAADTLTNTALAASAVTEIQAGLATSAVLGALADAAADGDPTTTDTVVAYLKQLINTLEGSAGIPVFPAAVVPGNAVSLAEAIRQIYSEVAGLDGASISVAPTAAAIADQVWDEARADHVAAGSFGQGAASVQGNVTGSVASVTGNVGGNVSGSVGSVATDGITAGSIAAGAIGASELAADAAAEVAAAVRTELATELARVDVATSTRASQASVDTVDDFLDTEVAAILAAVDTEVAAIKAKTDSLTFTTAGKVDAKLTSDGLANVQIEASISAGADLTNDTGTQLTAVTLPQAIALILAANAGVLAGAATTTITIKPGGKPSGNTRLAATVDASGNRSALTLKVPD